jgi:hypothetical protein
MCSPVMHRERKGILVMSRPNILEVDKMWDLLNVKMETYIYVKSVVILNTVICMDVMIPVSLLNVCLLNGV